jgi:hypothetical protein
VREGLILHVREGGEELGRLFLLHGHQGTFDSALPAARLLRYFAAHPTRLQFSLNTPARF